jgi:4a-hydroxytetrahydrobiopterin dehydratase
MVELKQMRCTACDSQAPLDSEIVQALLSQLHPDWKMNADNIQISRRFVFRNYWQTISFVNAIAWIAHQENHHPNLTVGFNYCEVHWTTHAIKGLSKNDFICAAKVDALLMPAS